MGVPGAEFNVVADHENGHAPAEQSLQNARNGPLELRVQPLGWLVHQKDVRLQQQYLRQRRPLLFAAGKVIGVPVQQSFQLTQGGHIGHQPILLRPAFFLPLQNFVKVLPDGLFYKQRLRVLGQHPYAAVKADVPAIRLAQAGQQLQRGGLAGAVSAQQGEEFPFPHFQ